ncbi:DnaJ-like protein subfamily C GRV2 [Raphanus sativus]|nr:DnaJ-like protein subfamily C GRV2 [Raphanus sativus]
MFHSATSFREGALHVLYALAGTQELAWAAPKHGGVVYILELCLCKGRSLSHDQCMCLTLVRFLPGGLVSIIRNGPGEAIDAFERTIETLELVWTLAMTTFLPAQTEIT